ncbi:hypothetical protein HDV57DRAFT_490206 [Trichoderma longibrachiatum]
MTIGFEPLMLFSLTARLISRCLQLVSFVTRSIIEFFSPRSSSHLTSFATVEKILMSWLPDETQRDVKICLKNSVVIYLPTRQIADE